MQDSSKLLNTRIPLQHTVKNTVKWNLGSSSHGRVRSGLARRAPLHEYHAAAARRAVGCRGVIGCVGVAGLEIGIGFLGSRTISGRSERCSWWWHIPTAVCNNLCGKISLITRQVKKCKYNHWSFLHVPFFQEMFGVGFRVRGI